MQADESLVAYIAGTYYNLSPILGSIKPLCGYSDKNFLLTDSNDHKTYVLKIVNKDESSAALAEVIDEISLNAHVYTNSKLSATNPPAQKCSFVVPKIVRTTGDKLSTFTSVRYRKATSGAGRPSEVAAVDDFESSLETVKCNIKLFEYFDGITMFDYLNHGTGVATLVKPPAPLAMAKLRGEKLYFKLGRVCNELFVFLRTQRHLIDRLKRARGDAFVWQIKTCAPHLRRLLGRLYPDAAHVKRLLVERVLSDYANQVASKLDQLPEFILHSDLCNKNILINWEPSSPFKDQVCLIDFQDLQVGQQVIELAAMMLYNVLEQEQMPFEKALKLIPHWLLAGYQSNAAAASQLEPAELLLVPTLMKLRLCQSLLNGQLAFEEDPSNSYVMHTNLRGWQLLLLMSDERSDFGDAAKLTSFWVNE